MLNLVVTLLIIALIAAVLGFGGIAGAAVEIAKVVFFVALVLFLIAALTEIFAGTPCSRSKHKPLTCRRAALGRPFRRRTHLEVPSGRSRCLLGCNFRA